MAVTFILTSTEHPLQDLQASRIIINDKHPETRRELDGCSIPGFPGRVMTWHSHGSHYSPTTTQAHLIQKNKT